MLWGPNNRFAMSPLGPEAAIGSREGISRHPANGGSAPEVGAHQTVASGFVIAPQTEGAWKEQP